MADSAGHLENPAERLLDAAAGELGGAPVARKLPLAMPRIASAAVSARQAARVLFRAARRLVWTHAFRLAFLYFLVFAFSVVGVLIFVYWSSADFVERQTEATLDAEITGLAEQYAQ